MQNQDKGKIGEEMSMTYLLKNEFQVIERNYKFKKGEIDLIAQKNNLLVFVEVKWRSNSDFGFPEESINSNQQKSIIKTAEQYIFEKNWQGNIRFDVIAITENEETKELQHFEDAFF